MPDAPPTPRITWAEVMAAPKFSPATKRLLRETLREIARRVNAGLEAGGQTPGLERTEERLIGLWDAGEIAFRTTRNPNGIGLVEWSRTFRRYFPLFRWPK